MVLMVSPNHCLSLAKRSSALANCFVSTAVSSPRRKADLNIRLASPRCSSDLTRHKVKWERASSIVEAARAGGCRGTPTSSASRAEPPSEPSPKYFSALQQRLSSELSPKSFSALQQRLRSQPSAKYFSALQQRLSSEPSAKSFSALQLRLRSEPSAKHSLHCSKG